VPRGPYLRPVCEVREIVSVRASIACLARSSCAEAESFAVVIELLCCREKQKILDLVPPTSKTPRDSWNDPPPQILVPEIIHAHSVADLGVAA
jgi:hypothetical protein